MMSSGRESSHAEFFPVVAFVFELPSVIPNPKPNALALTLALNCTRLKVI